MRKQRSIAGYFEVLRLMYASNLNAGISLLYVGAFSSDFSHPGAVFEPLCWFFPSQDPGFCISDLIPG